MDFSLSDEHRMVQQMVRDFVAREVTPVIKDYDRRQETAAFLLPRMGELGLLGIHIPAKIQNPVLLSSSPWRQV